MASTTYYWDEVDDNVCCEEDENGEITASYTHEPGLYGEVIAQKRGHEVRYYNYDGEGNTCELTDEEQNVTDTSEYSAFGEEVARTGMTENPFGYKGALGYYANGEMNDFYVRVRMYEARVARFLSEDPLGIHHDSNLYWYAMNRPGSLADPSGKLTVEVTPPANLDDARTCGHLFDVGFNFKLQRDAMCEGFFVQKVSVFCHVRDCECGLPPDTVTTGTPTFIYFEAKHVPATAKQGTTVFPDTAHIGSRIGKCGAMRQVGQGRFFCATKVPNFLTVWPWYPSLGVDTDCATVGGPYAKEFADDPDWWNNYERDETQRLRYAGVRWKCCSGCDDDVRPEHSKSVTK